MLRCRSLWAKEQKAGQCGSLEASVGCTEFELPQLHSRPSPETPKMCKEFGSAKQKTGPGNCILLHVLPFYLASLPVILQKYSETIFICCSITKMLH